jgi:type I restriction enzyme, R subunit
VLATPEAAARQTIDASLEAAGWSLQTVSSMNLYAGRGIPVREFPLKTGFGIADYMLFVDGQAVGAIEAKKEGDTLTGVEVQTARYAGGLRDTMPAPTRPLPFLYESTGIETQFTNLLDPDPRSRRVFRFHRPESLAGWISDLYRRSSTLQLNY